MCTHREFSSALWGSEDNFEELICSLCVGPVDDSDSKLLPLSLLASPCPRYWL